MSGTDRPADSTDERTIPQLLHRNAEQYPELPALIRGDDRMSWRQLRADVAAVSRGLASVGLDRGSCLLIMSAIRAEHTVVDLAAAHLGAIPCTAYATLSTDQIRFVAEHSGAPVVVLEDAEMLARWRPVIDRLPALRRIVLLDETAVPEADDRFVDYRQLRAHGEALHAADPAVFEQSWQKITLSDPVSMIYTSGTTGDPKAVILSHHTVAAESAVIDALADAPMHEPGISYLPLAHIAGRMNGIYHPIFKAAPVHLCPDPTQVVAALKEVRPFSIFAVPRIWEKMAAGLQGVIATMDEPKRAAIGAANELALRVFDLRAAGEPVPDELAERFAAVDEQVLRPIRGMLGLDKTKHTSSGAAPIPVETIRYLAGFGIDVLEVWGLSETTGAATANRPDCFRVGTVGKAVPGVDLKVAEDGEIFVRGSIVVDGYRQADGSVASLTDEDGWFATGDIGTIDADGFLTITDRKKEIIITSGGKNIAPAQVENLLRAHPLVGQAVAIGDRRPYVTALIVLDEESAPAWAASRGITDADPAGLAEHPDVRAELDALVASANERLARVEQIKRYHVLGDPWSPESGELTPTLKLRRRVIHEQYGDVIDSMYN